MPTLKLPSGIRGLLQGMPHDWKVALTARAGKLGIRLEDRTIPPKATIEGLRSGPIVVSGFFSDNRGVARSAALTVSALEAAGLPVVRHDISYLLRSEPVVRSPVQAEGGVWILHCNPPEAVAVLRLQTDLSRSAMFRIGYWAWELPRAPAMWCELAREFHEIWAPSRFTAAAFSDVQTPVRVMPHRIPLTHDVERAGPLDVIQFTTFADLRSSAARKNPAGTIEAYVRAFPDQGHTRLVVKLSGTETAPDTLALLCQQASLRQDIEIVDQSLSQAEMNALVARTDVLVSLHRAEGFGLTIAEAMAAKKAIVVTAWSGNTDFMPDLPVQRVPWRLTPIADQSGLYADQDWAEPDLDYAAASMTKLASDPGLLQKCGQANGSALSITHAPWAREALLKQPFSSWITET